MKHLTRIAVLLIATSLLMSCTSARQLAQCPSVGILAEASSLTAFAPGKAETPDNQLYRIDATRATTDCSVEERTRLVTSSLNITFQAARPNGGAAAQFTVPYFVSVTAPGGRILTKKLFSAPLNFAAGQTSASFQQSIDSTVIKVDNDKHAYDYQILTGFQLTKAQLDFNRKFNRFAQ